MNPLRTSAQKPPKTKPLKPQIIKQIAAFGVLTAVFFSCAYENLARAQQQLPMKPMARKVYVFSSDFPPGGLINYPASSQKQSAFWGDLNQAFLNTPRLMLTNAVEDADYRVELRCSGIVNCKHLTVDLKSAKRVALTAFRLKDIRNWFGDPDYSLVSTRLVEVLNQKIAQVERGGFVTVTDEP
ncbi:MAG: hypothetical protein AAGI66_07970 [Cyanobacteria bacterium P01_H01_bin.74]